MSDVVRDAQTIALRLLLVREACASVAIGHADLWTDGQCPCIVCAAAHGELDALFELANALGL